MLPRWYLKKIREALIDSDHSVYNSKSLFDFGPFKDQQLKKYEPFKDQIH